MVLPFPFSDLEQAKKRPALLVSEWRPVSAQGLVETAIACQITSKAYHDDAILIENQDFADGSLNRPSYAVPSQIFTIHRDAVESYVGHLREEKYDEIVDALTKQFRR
jgi:mRNA interferase MazF